MLGNGSLLLFQTEFHITCRVIDLGVMTPCEKILKTAIEEKAGIMSIEVYFAAKK